MENTTKAIKLYQTGKDGIESFALRINAEHSLSNQEIGRLIAASLFRFGQKSRKWANKNMRFSGFALSKPCYFIAGNRTLDASVSAELKLRLKFRENLTEDDYLDLVADLMEVVDLKNGILLQRREDGTPRNLTPAKKQLENKPK